jgi:hypothetical protein
MRAKLDRPQGRLFKLFVLGFALVAPLLGVFQNCAEVRLTRVDSSATQESAEVYDTTQLPGPIEKPIRVRVVALFDHSFSMLLGRCESELEGVLPNGKGELDASCTRALGADHEGDRFQILREWRRQLAEINRYASLFNIPNAAKIAIRPFSGGRYQRPLRNTNEANEMGFRMPPVPGTPEDLADPLRAYITQLEREHADEKALFAGNRLAAARKLGTTIPTKPILDSRALMMQELAQAKTDGVLDKTIFRFIFMSDGAFKPFTAQFEAGRIAMGCPTPQQCAADPTLPACSAAASANFADTPDMPNPFKICGSDYLARFGEAFGSDFASNTYDEIKLALASIKTIPETDAAYRGVRLSVSLAQIRPNRLHTDERQPIVKNMFDDLSKDLELEKHVVNGPNPPFSIASGGKVLNFEIANFYIINLNAFVNGEGRLVADSDGDGLADEEEPLHANSTVFNPIEPRSNGFCLDVITANDGCLKFGCSQTRDEDGDGLNECEEKTLGTNPKVMDTDGDMITDFHEVIRGLNPRLDQSALVPQDNLPLHLRFGMGAVPGAPRSKLGPENTIRYSTKLLGYAPYPGRAAVTPKYAVDIQNVPLAQTLGTPVSVGPYPVRPPDVLIPLEARAFNQGPVLSPRGRNQVLVVIRVSARENPKFNYWLAKRIDLDFVPSGRQSLNSLNFSTFVPLEFLDSGEGL